MQVFIGSSGNDQIDKEYFELAKKISDALIELDYDLLFGAYSPSMMGECYKSFANANRKITGVSLPEYQNDIINLSKMDNIIVNNSSERIRYIYEHADLLLILPGGIGTLAELFGFLEEAKTDTKIKKIILYNYKGYYDKLLEFLNSKIRDKFININDYKRLFIINNINDLIKECKNGRN